MRGDVPEQPHTFGLTFCLRSLVGISATHPWFTLCVTALLCALSASYTLNCLKFKTERSDLINPNTEFQRRWVKYTAAFHDEADMVVAVEGDSPELIKHVLDDLGPRVERDKGLFGNV